jgi:hypothetical protein
MQGTSATARSSSGAALLDSRQPELTMGEFRPPRFYVRGAPTAPGFLEPNQWRYLPAFFA